MRATNQTSRRGRSRRQFLAQTAFAGAAALVGARASSSVLNMPVLRAKPRVKLGKGDPIRIAVIGPGGMGKGHVGAFLNFNKTGRESVHIVALADCCSVQVADAMKMVERDQTSVQCQGYADYREVLKRDDVHAVLIASPEHWHAQMTIDAIHAGKDVYCEKPMTLRLPEALKVREVQNANPDVLVQIGTQKMMLPKYNEAMKLVAAGAIGKPTFSQTSYCRNSKDGEWLYYAIDKRIKPGETIDWDAWCGQLGPRPWNHEIYHRWRRYKDFSTGIMGDLLVHEITPLMMALNVGWPTKVQGIGGHYIDKKMENHDQVNLTVQFEKEHTMIVAGSTCNDQGLETMIRGHKATMYLGGNNVVIRPQRIYVDEIEEQTVNCPNISNDQDELRLNWLHCIRTREPVKSPVEFATQVMVIVDLATRSAWENKTFTFDPETHTTHAA
ncbi:MAG: Gfo/Idh/MocA family oxidoreductase [Phycisphaeraceae bacterium]|nr:Gfo/Idh/MocA family oxidoreductase [Phycisphaerales bacterium]QOJ18830.1 MAG: Gfo/Idh/MocA family oxidoreductase [Phycisphaeraceae bacterium]